MRRERERVEDREWEWQTKIIRKEEIETRKKGKEIIKGK